MIRVADIGNFATKDNLGNIFESRISSVGNILKNKYEMVLNDEIYYLGGGCYENELQRNKNYNKISRLWKF